MRRTLIILTALAGIAAAAIPARACLFSLFIPNEEARDVAATGYLVRASVVRGYDPYTRTPELLKVEKVFVGEDLPATIELSHPDKFYEARKGLEGKIIADDFDCSDKFSRREPWPYGQLLVLVPDGPPVPGQPWRFRVTEDYGWALKRTRSNDPKAFFAPLIDAARKTGRLRASPLERP